MDEVTKKPLHEQAVAVLINRFGLDERMYFKTGSGWETKLILRRIAIDMIEEKLGIIFQTSGVVGSGKEWGVVMKARLANSPRWIETVASAGPDTTTFPYRLEIAYKRARHRLVIKMAQLSHLNVFSEDESEDFGLVDQSSKRVEEVLKDVPEVAPKNNLTLTETIEKIYGAVEEVKKKALKRQSINEEKPDTDHAPEAGDVHASKDGKGGKAKPGKPGGFAPRRVDS